MTSSPWVAFHPGTPASWPAWLCPLSSLSPGRHNTELVCYSLFRFEGDVRNIVYADTEDSRPKHQNMMAYKVSVCSHIYWLELNSLFLFFKSGVKQYGNTIFWWTSEFIIYRFWIGVFILNNEYIMCLSSNCSFFFTVVFVWICTCIGSQTLVHLLYPFIRTIHVGET